ncbi:tetratricopeptide repeat protein [Micromonospora echinofusca]|uniref:tetratricopeptide repeat protein n=1 Tax=Micromonospora echinofusca TaxID=47858 RepID=UPI0020202A11|nr:tetratricopeptide repeat protein [Micromonospora sp. MSM11]MCL7457537.1 tetratricopeptide repeat protein [Micromonospora sp. MSM11]
MRGIGVGAGRDIKGPLTINTVLDAGPSPSAAGLSVAPPVGRLPPRVWGRQPVIDEVLSAVDLMVRQQRYGERTTRPIWLLHGLGGVGKSAVALAIAVQAARAGVQPFWVDASDRSRVQAAMWLVARQLAGPDFQVPASPDEAGAVDAVWSVLERATTNWLLIVDNADDPQFLAADGERTDAGNGWLRASAGGLVLVTSRVGDLSVWGRRVMARRLSTLSPSDGGQVLLDSADLDAEGRGAERTDAENLAERLGGLPLALRAAGRYLATSRARGAALRVADYDALLARRFSATIDAATRTATSLGAGEPSPRDLVTATWDLSLEWLAERGLPDAGSVLALLSCFANAPVPSSLIQQVASGNEATAVLARADALVSALRALALIDDHHAGEPAVGQADPAVRHHLITVHPLVHEVMRERLLAEPSRAAATRSDAVRALVSALTDSPDGPAVNGGQLYVLDPHLRRLATDLTNDPGYVPEALRHRFVRAVSGVSQAVAALLAAEAAVDSLTIYLSLATAVAGRRAKVTRAFQHRRGHCLWGLERFDAAAVDLRESGNLFMRMLCRISPHVGLVAQTSVCGLRLPRQDAELQLTAARTQLSVMRWHPLSRTSRALETRHNSVRILEQHGQLEEAEQAYRALLAAMRAALGEGHHVALTAWEDLALLLRRRGRLDEAEAELRALLEVAERGEGDVSVRALRVRSRLASVLARQKRTAEAEREYRASVEAMTRQCGADDRRTLVMRRELASFLRACDRYAEAEAEYREILRAEVRLAGEDSSPVWLTRSDLALVARDQDRHAEAEAEYRAVWQAFRRSRGDAHPSTLACRGQLARVLADQGRFAEAEAELRGVLDLQIEALGPDDKDTIDTRLVLAEVLTDQGHDQAARAEYLLVVDARRQVLGEEHPRTLTTTHRLAHVTARTGDHTTAETLFREVAGKQARVLGPEHVRTLRSRRCLARQLRDRGKLDEAESEFREVLDLMRRTLGDLDPTTVRTWHDLARIVGLQGRFVDAEAELRQVLAWRAEAAGEEAPSTVEVRFELGQMLDAQGRFDDAEREYREVLRVRSRDLGPEHHLTCATLALLARASQQPLDAAGHWRDAFVAARAALGEDHLDTLRFGDLLVDELVAAEQLDEAESMARQALEDRTGRFGPDHSATREARARLAGISNLRANRHDAS